MGVSIECYRARIGSFKNSSCSKRKSTNEMSSNNTKNSKLKQNFLKLLAVLWILLFLSTMLSNTSESSIYISHLGKYSTVIRKLIQPAGRTYLSEKSLYLSKSSIIPFHPSGRKSSFVSTQSINPSESSIYIHPLGKTSTFIRKRFQPWGRTYKVGKSLNLSVRSLNPYHPP